MRVRRLAEGLALEQRAEQRLLLPGEHALLRASQPAELRHHVLMAGLVRADGLQQSQAAHRLPIVLREVVERRLLLEQRLQPRLH